MELTSYYNQIAELYREKAQSFPKETLDYFLSYVQEEGSVLDVGCGPGIETDYIRRQGYRAHGIDASEEMIRLARREFPEVAFSQEDIRNLNGKTVYDGIWCSAVLMYYDRTTRGDILHNNIFPSASSVVGLVVPLGEDGKKMTAKIPFYFFTKEGFEEEVAHGQWEIIHSEVVTMRTSWIFVISQKKSSFLEI